MTSTTFSLIPDECVFCAKVAAAKGFQSDPQSVINFQPLNPVTIGHRLFIPAWHVADYKEHPGTAAIVNQAVSEYAQWYGGDSSIITSSGVDATQTVFHYHVHFIPRHAGDGLHLPWTGQAERENR